LLRRCLTLFIILMWIVNVSTC
ncbi:hypothetical protein D046_7694B, partial [Vibrio parahaemolyticus V-223/04]